MNRFPSQFRVTCHTDHVGPGSTFVAIRGFKEDGVAYIPLALERGATHIVIEKNVQLDEEVYALIKENQAELIRVLCTRKALGNLAAEAYGYPNKALKIIGITGTKGKTTTSYLLEHILKTAGKKTALLGTIANRIGDTEYQASLTTPHPDYLYAFLALCKEEGAEYVILEAAAQALSMHRLDTLKFDSVIFTNFSLEHSEFYASLDEYFRAKCQLFCLLERNALVVLNADDEKVVRCAPDWPNRTLISMHGKGAYNGELIESTLSSLKLSVKKDDTLHTFSSQALLGEFSAYNLMSAYAVAERYGVSADELQKALDSFTGVPGRICSYPLPNKAVAIIDNAHTPSSFEAFFKAVRPLSPQIIAVFSCGGDRDALKRPLMGAVAAEYADQIILTTDNPRSEDPEDIVAAILEGIPKEARDKVTIELDREKAIVQAYAQSKEGSLLALLGKGPVEYQHIQDKKIPFSEAAILRALRS